MSESERELAEAVERVLTAFEQNPSAWAGVEDRVRRFIEEWRGLAQVPEDAGQVPRGELDQPTQPRGTLDLLPVERKTRSVMIPSGRHSPPRRAKLSRTRLAVVALVPLTIILSGTTIGLGIAMERSSQALQERTKGTEVAETTFRELIVLLKKIKQHSKDGSVNLTKDQLDSLMRTVELGQSQLQSHAARGPVYSGDKSHFVRDVTYPDDSDVLAGKSFVKIWEIANAGSVRWKSRFLQREGPGDAAGKMKSAKRVPIPYTEPGQRCTISVPLEAPDVLGPSYAEWKMVDEDGTYLLPAQQPLFVLVNVVIAHGKEKTSR